MKSLALIEKLFQFWRGSLAEAKTAFSEQLPKGELTILIQGNENPVVEMPTESELESELGLLISKGHSLSEAVKLVSEGMSMKKKLVYTLAVRKFGKKLESREQEP